MDTAIIGVLLLKKSLSRSDHNIFSQGLEQCGEVAHLLLGGLALQRVEDPDRGVSPRGQRDDGGAFWLPKEKK